MEITIKLEMLNQILVRWKALSRLKKFDLNKRENSLGVC